MGLFAKAWIADEMLEFFAYYNRHRCREAISSRIMRKAQVFFDKMRDFTSVFDLFAVLMKQKNQYLTCTSGETWASGRLLQRQMESERGQQ